MSQIFGFQITDGLQNLSGDQLKVVGDAAHGLQRVQQQRGCGTQRIGGLSGDDTAVLQHHGAGRTLGGLCLQQSRGNSGTDRRGHIRFLHHQFQPHHRFFIALTLQLLHAGSIVAAENLPAGRITASRIIHDAVAHHVDAHIRGGLIGGLALNLLEDRVQDGEDLHIAVIVDGSLAVSLQMEGVDHIHIVQIRRGGLISQIDRMSQRQIPDGEGLKLGVTGLDAPLVVMVQLAQAGGHLAAAGTGRRDYHQGVTGLNIVVFTQALIADDMFYIRGIAGNGIMTVAANAQSCQPFQEGIGRRLAVVTVHNHAAHIQLHTPENVDQTKNIVIVGDAQITAHLVLLDISGVNGNDDLNILFQLLQHPDLAVRLKARQNAGCMEIVKQLSAKFQIQLSAELVNALLDLLRLRGEVFLIVKSNGSHDLRLPLWWFYRFGSPRNCRFSRAKPGVHRELHANQKYCITSSFGLEEKFAAPGNSFCLKRHFLFRYIKINYCRYHHFILYLCAKGGYNMIGLERQLR